MTESPQQGAVCWTAAIVNHGSFDDLEACLASIRAQTHPPQAIVVWDTGVDASALAQVRTAHRDVVFVGGSNRGYAGGANGAIEAALASSGGDAPDHVLILNPDVVLDPDFAERLGAAVQARPDVAIATGKLLRPGRQLLDSAGILFPRHRRPRDRGSEVPDTGQFDRLERVDAASGAAFWLRVAAIDRLRIEEELFDESFFAYHEDTDLCWRARRLGFEILYVPEAVAVHARGWRRNARTRIAVPIRRHSFKNHYLQLVKNESGLDLLLNAPWLLVWEGLRLGFVVLRDRSLAPAYLDALRLLPQALRRRRKIQERVSER